MGDAVFKNVDTRNELYTHAMGQVCQNQFHQRHGAPVKMVMPYPLVKKAKEILQTGGN